MNFLFLFPDEMCAGSLSCYGNKYSHTPNIDKLAEESTLFKNCFVQNPVCSPSRCSLMTGTYVHNRGHRTLWHLLQPDEPSLFRYLKNQGIIYSGMEKMIYTARRIWMKFVMISMRNAKRAIHLHAISIKQKIIFHQVNQAIILSGMKMYIARRSP